MNNIIVLNSSGKEEWLNLLNKFNNNLGQDIYQSPYYVELYEKKLCSVTEAFVYNSKNNYFCLAYLKNSINKSLINDHYDFETAYGYSGPISTTDDQKFLNSAWESFKKHCLKNSIVAGLIRFNPLLKNHVFAKHSCIQVDFEKEIVVNTLNKENKKFWEKYSPNTRNKIRKAIKNQIEIKNNSSNESIIIFGKLYRSVMEEKKVEKKYLFVDEYFQKIFNNLSGKFNVFLAYKDNEIIGGALLLFSKNSVIVHLSATKKSFSKYGAASLLRHEIIEFYSKKGIYQINFGGGLTSKKDDALLNFKKGFSQETEKYYIGKCIINKELYTNLCSKWDNQYKKKNNNFSNYFLKYNYID